MNVIFAVHNVSEQIEINNGMEPLPADATDHVQRNTYKDVKKKAYIRLSAIIATNMVTMPMSVGQERERRIKGMKKKLNL